MLPHKSNTHKEQFFHLFQKHGVDTPHFAHTVFCREELDKNGTSLGWFGQYSTCVQGDADRFCRKYGRNLARRKYFNSVAKTIWIGFSKPKYEDIRAILEETVNK